MEALDRLSATNDSVLPACLLLVFAPRWRGTERVVFSGLAPLLLGITLDAP